MRRIVAGAFMTLDGVVQDPGGFGEIERGGWAHAFFDEQAREHATERVLAADRFLLGRRTYELLERAWSKNSGPYAEAINAIPKVVVSSTLSGPLPWNATAVDGDAVAELDGTSLIYGSFTLVRNLLRRKLIDEFTIGVHPLVLGSGRRLFEDGGPGDLRLLGSTQLATGVVSLSYGAPSSG